jgi:hypothetical protein
MIDEKALEELLASERSGNSRDPKPTGIVMSWNTFCAVMKFIHESTQHEHEDPSLADAQKS